MCRKTPAVAYITRRLRTTNRREIIAEIKDAPLKQKDRDLLTMFLDGATYKEMAQEFHLSESRINKWKRALFEQLFRYEQSMR